MTEKINISIKKKKTFNKEFTFSLLYSLISSLLGFTFSFIAARVLQADLYGELQYYLGISNILTLFITFGIDNRIIKTMQYNKDPLSKKKDLARYYVLLLLTSLIALPLYFVVAYFALYRLNKDVFIIILIYLCGVIGAFSAIMYVYFTSINKHEIRILISGIVPHLIFLGILGFHYVTGTMKSFISNYFYYLIGIFVLTILPLIFSYCRKPQKFFTKKDIIACLFYMLFITSSNLEGEFSKIILGEAYDSFGVVGIISISSQITIIADKITSIISQTCLPTFSKIYKSGDKEKLLSFFKTINRINIYISVPIYIALAIEARTVLYIFGSSYTAYPLILTLTAVNAAITTFTGPTGSLLAMSDGEHKLLIQSLIKFGIFILVGFLLVKQTVYGLSIASLCSCVISNVVKIFMVRFQFKRSFVDKQTFIVLLCVSFISIPIFLLMNSINDIFIWVIMNMVHGLGLIIFFFVVSPFKNDKNFFLKGKNIYE